jgi:hypothetical protein
MQTLPFTGNADQLLLASLVRRNIVPHVFPSSSSQQNAYAMYTWEEEEEEVEEEEGPLKPLAPTNGVFIDLSSIMHRNAHMGPTGCTWEDDEEEEELL